MKKIYLFAFIAVAVMLSACSNNQFDKKYDATLMKEDVAGLVDKELISGDEKSLLVNFINTWNADSLAGKTYGELLAKAKTLAEEKAERKRVLNESLTISVTKKYTPYHLGKEYLILDITVKNNTENDIAGYVFTLNFKNAEGKIFGSFEWSITAGVKAKSKTKRSLNCGEHDGSNTAQQQLKAADLSKITVEYEISRIMYNDGTSLNLEQ
jgi:hypothetical protein